MAGHGPRFRQRDRGLDADRALWLFLVVVTAPNLRLFGRINTDLGDVVAIGNRKGLRPVMVNGLRVSCLFCLDLQGVGNSDKASLRFREDVQSRGADGIRERGDLVGDLLHKSADVA